jgi:tetratricopeptide (TPR) repeat protein
MSQEHDLDLARSYINEWIEKVEYQRQWGENDHHQFLKDTAQAKKIIDQILKADAQHQEARIELARWHLCQAKSEGQFKDGAKKAIKHMEQVISIVPDVGNYRCSLGLLYARAGKKELATEQLEKAIQLEPHNMDFKKELDRIKAGSKRCFIATAVYGSYYAADVMVLREFREQVLLKCSIGRLFVKVYYLTSPVVAKLIAENKALSECIRLRVMVPFVRYLKRRR